MSHLVHFMSFRNLGCAAAPPPTKSGHLSTRRPNLSQLEADIAATPRKACPPGRGGRSQGGALFNAQLAMTRLVRKPEIVLPHRGGHSRLRFTRMIRRWIMWIWNEDGCFQFAVCHFDELWANLTPLRDKCQRSFGYVWVHSQEGPSLAVGMSLDADFGRRHVKTPKKILSQMELDWR